MSTSEAGTGIKSIFEEMIDTGSQVSEILQNKTGKSFTELMNEGKTLTDVLSIIQEHADATGVSFTELWSSENAGITGLQLLSSEGGSFNDILGQISNSSGTLGESFDKMANTSAFKLQSSINELKNSLIDFGGALAPVIDGVSSFISAFAKGLDALPNGVKAIAGAVTAFIATLAPLAKVGSKVFDILGKGMNLFIGDQALFGAKGTKAINKTISKLTGNKNGKSFEIPITFAPDMNIQTIKKDLIKATGEKGFSIGVDMDATKLKGVNTEVKNTGGIFKKTWSFIKAHPIGVAMTVGATATIAMYRELSKRQEEYLNKYKNQKKIAQEGMETNKKNISTYESQIDSLKGIAKEYDTLASKTNRTAKEQERYVELTKEIAEIMPELVTGYDIDGNPILALDNGVKGLIDSLREALGLEKDLFSVRERKSTKATFGQQGRDIAQFKSDIQEEKRGYQELEEARKDALQRLKEANTEEEKQTALNSLREANADITAWYAEYNGKIKEHTNALKENNAESAEYFKNYISQNEAFTKSNEESQKAMQQFISSMDFSEFGENEIGQVESAMDSIMEKVKEGKIDLSAFKEEQKSLNTLFTSGDIDGYNKALDEMVSKYAEITGIDPDILRRMFSGVDADVSKLVGEVDGFSKATQDMMNNLTGMYELGNDERKIHLKAMLDTENLDADIKKQIFDALEDGKVTDEEIELIMEAVLGVEVKNEKEVQDKLDTLRQGLGGIEGLNDKIEYEIYVDVKEGDVKGLQETLKGLDEQKQIDILTEVVKSGAMTPEQLDEVLKGLPENVRTEIETIIEKNEAGELEQTISNLPETASVLLSVEFERRDEVQEFAKTLDTIPADKTTKMNVLTAVANNDVDALLKSIETLPPETQLEIITNASMAFGTLNEVDNYKLATKIQQIKADNSDVEQKKKQNQQPTSSTHTNNVNNSAVDSAKNKNKQPTNSTHTNKVNNSAVDSAKSKNKQATNSQHKISANNSAVESAKAKNQKNTSSTHTINIIQKIKTIGKAITGAVGSLFQSAGEPEIIELNQPYKVKATPTVQSVEQPTILNELANNVASTMSNAENTVKISASNIASIMATTSKKTGSTKVKPNIDTSQTTTALKYNIDLLNNMSNLLSKLSTQVDTLGAKLQRTWGSNSTKLIKEQISLLTKQQSLTKVNIKNMEGMASKLKSSLKKSGFKFKDDGSISNYNSKLIAMEKNVEKLKKKEEAYNGKNEKTKNKLAKAYEKANNELQTTKDKLSEYYDLQFNSIPQAKQQWEDYANSIAEARAEIIKADREAKTFFEDVREEIKNAYFDRNNTYIETLEIKADLSGWKEAQSYLNQAEKWLLENQRLQEGIKENAKNRAKDNKNILDKYGFKYSSSGAITNAEKNLEKLRKKLSPAEYEAVKEAYDSYINDICNTIPNAEKEWWSLQQSIEENRKSIEETAQAMKEMVEGANLTQLNAKYDRLSDTLDLLEAKMDLAYGKNKIKYMEEQVDLLQQMSTESEKLANENKILADSYKQQLSSMGVFFDSNGDITNLQSVMASQGTLDDMEELSDLVDKYNDSLSGIRDANKSVIENTKSVNDLKDAIIELNDELDEIRNNAWAKEFDNNIKIIQNRLDKLDTQFELSGANQLELLNEKIKVYQELEKATEGSLYYYDTRQKELARALKDYGFTINDNGSINNTADRLEMLKNTLSDVEFDHVDNLLQEYFDVALDTIPELEKELLDLQKSFEDVEKEKLNITKDVEDKITDIIEKQVEERKKKIEEEAKARVKALQDAQKEYQKWRDEADYKDDYDEQLKKVQDLQKKLEIAKRDDSLSGNKRIADLMEQLQEEQKNLEEMVQDRIDTQINDMFDTQIDKIESDSEDEIKRLEELWSETNIAKAVQESLKTGIFTSVDGEITSLKDAMIDMTNSSVEYMSVLGDSMRTELLSNLEVALDTAQQLGRAMENVDYNSIKYAGVGYDSATVQGNTTNNNTSNVINVDFNYQINAESGATVDEEAIANALAQSKQEIVSEIQTSILKYAK